MPKQLLNVAIKSPAWFFAVCFALWFAAHSFIAFLFVCAAVVAWIKRSIKTSLKEDMADEAKAPNVVVPAPAPAEVKVTPIRRQYAKSAVVVPIKTGTGD